MYFKWILVLFFSGLIEKCYFLFEKRLVNPALDLRKTPFITYRTGGSFSYGEWCYNVGIFRSLIRDNLQNNRAPKILDVGCGTGLMAIACRSFLTNNNGQFIGIDINKRSIDFAHKNYPWQNFQFIHIPNYNAYYAPHQNSVRQQWPIEDNSIDLATAVSVWTHLNEQDSLWYMGELSRVLKKGAKTIITFFIIDSDYHKNINNANSYINKIGLVFSVPMYSSKNWFTTDWTRVPENAVAITESGLCLLEKTSGLKIVKAYSGHWKKEDMGVDGLHLQDVIIFEK